MDRPNPSVFEADTGISGFRLWPSALSLEAQTLLRDAILNVIKQAPLYRPVTPGGRPFSVQMTNLGPLGWVSDATGYRYQSTHPLTGANWPDIPPDLIKLWHQLTGWSAPPDACLVNLYQGDARMGLHQDKDEKDLTAPVLSVSLGDSAMFRIGTGEGSKTRAFKLSSGDVCALSGPSRLARHGIDRILVGSSRLIPNGGRINLTLRRAR